jgi:hypothetical protein
MALIEEVLSEEYRKGKFRCELGERWGTYELARGTSDSEGEVQVSLKLDVEELIAAEASFRDIGVELRVSRVLDTGELASMGERRVRVSKDSFTLDPNHPVIRSAILEVLGREGDVDVSLRRLSESTYESCIHVSDPRQWLRDDQHWTSSTNKGVVRVGDKYVELGFEGGPEPRYLCKEQE